jgi:hypothetical protein
MENIDYMIPRNKIETIKYKLFGKLLHNYANRLLSRMQERGIIGNDAFHYWNNFSGKTLNRPGHNN